MNRLLSCLIPSGLIAACLLGSLWPSTAEPPSLPTARADKEPRRTPTRIPVGEVPMSDRRVIYLEKGISGALKFIYFHRPLFCFYEAGAKTSGLPATVHAVEPQGQGGELLVTFKLASSSPEFRQKCKQILIARLGADEAAGVKPDHPVEATEVVRYPLLHVFAKCRLGAETLAAGESARLDDAGDDFELTMAFSRANFERFKVGHAAGKARFDFTYLYEGVKAGRATSYVQVQRTIGQEVQRSLESRNLKPGSPLFQADYNAVRQRVEASVRRTILATDKDAARMLQEKALDQVIGTLFAREAAPLDALEGNSDRALQDGFRSYIKALEQTTRVQRHTDEEWRQLQEERKKKVRTNELRGGLQLSIPVAKDVTLGIDLSGSLTATDEEEARTEIEQKRGLKTTWDKETRTFNAHQIIIHRLSDSWQESSLSIVDSVFLVSETHNSYATATPVPSTFLYDHILQEKLPTGGQVVFQHRLKMAEQSLKAKTALLEEKQITQKKLIDQIATLAVPQPTPLGPDETGRITRSIAELATTLKALNGDIKTIGAEVLQLRKQVVELKASIGE